MQKSKVLVSRFLLFIRPVYKISILDILLIAFTLNKKVNNKFKRLPGFYLNQVNISRSPVLFVKL